MIANRITPACPYILPSARRRSGMVARQVRRSVVMSNLQIRLLPMDSDRTPLEKGKDVLHGAARAAPLRQSVEQPCPACFGRRGRARACAAPASSGIGSALRWLPVSRRYGVDHPWDAEPVDQGAEARRPERLAKEHDRLAVFRQLIEPALALGLVLGVQGDVEAVLHRGKADR